jgi:hypothetical protein
MGLLRGMGAFLDFSKESTHSQTKEETQTYLTQESLGNVAGNRARIAGKRAPGLG